MLSLAVTSLAMVTFLRFITSNEFDLISFLCDDTLNSSEIL